MFDHKDDEILYELRVISGTLLRLEKQMAIDLTALQAVDQQILDKVSAIPATITAESTKIQASIDALAAAAAGSTDPATTLAIAAEVAKLQGVSTNLDGVSAAINALPTTPSTPATPPVSGQ